MARSNRVSSILALAVLLASSAASAIEVTTGTDDLILNINPQVQPRFESDVDGPPGSAAPSGHANFDFFIRRARLLLRGTAYKQFTFALLLNAARLGERGNYNVSPTVQDVHIGYVPVKDVNIEIGLLYMPLTHAALSSATDTSALEIPADILLYNNARNLRETGVQLRALFVDRPVLVRGGVYEGARNTNPPTALALNPQGAPLAAGMIRLNSLATSRPTRTPESISTGKRASRSAWARTTSRTREGSKRERAPTMTISRSLPTSSRTSLSLPAPRRS